jgi:DNA-binding HxlR family transcriptional regulator
MGKEQDNEVVENEKKKEKGSLVHDLDKIIHEPVRLGIMTILYSIKSVSFSYLKKELKISDGNLFTHLKTLEKSQYISVKKAFINRKPQTTYEITDKGSKAYIEHVKNLEKIISKI